MAGGPLDLRGRAIIADGATPTLNSIKASLDQIGASAQKISTGQYLGNVARSIHSGARQAQRQVEALGGEARAAAAPIKRLIDETREFQEQVYGYSFANIPDNKKGLLIDHEGLKADTKAMAQEARNVAKVFGLVPSEVMKARTEVAKVGMSGDQANSMWMSAIGLNLADPKIPIDQSVKYLNAMWRMYSDQRKELAARMGVDMNNPKQKAWFDDQWLKGLAAKSAIAAAMSSIDPQELLMGVKQYAPVWADLGMRPEEVLGVLAHGANFGFSAPELGTAFKSWGNRLVKPTAGGLRWISNLKMDQSKWIEGFGPADPAGAATRLNDLLGGQLYQGKGGLGFKAEIRALLDEAVKAGKTASPEFQGELSQRIQRKLGAGWEGKTDEVQEAVRSATLRADGKISVFDFIREGLAKGMSRPAMLEVLEGKHIARNTPLFRYFDQLVDMVQSLDKVGGMDLDGIMKNRMESIAGQTKAMEGAWENLMIALGNTAPVETAKKAWTDLLNLLSGMDRSTANVATSLGLLVGGITALGTAIIAARGALALAGIGRGVPAGGAAPAASRGGMGALGWLGLGVTGFGLWDAARQWKNQPENKSRIDGFYKRLWQKGESWPQFEMPSVIGSARAQGAPGNPLAGTVVDNGAAQPSSEAQGQMAAAVQAAQSASQQILATFQQIDLTAEGQRIGESLAAGLRSGLASAVSAVEEAGAQIAAAASRINLNTGPAMQGAR